MSESGARLILAGSCPALLVQGKVVEPDAATVAAGLYDRPVERDRALCRLPDQPGDELRLALMAQVGPYIWLIPVVLPINTATDLD